VADFEPIRSRVCEMIFISDEMGGSGVFFGPLVNTTVWRSHE